jgi:hypothetical protein
MRKYRKRVLNISLTAALFSLASSQSAHADTFTEALTSGKASANFNLRYEGVEQNNPAQDASAFTLRSLLAYDTASYKGFSAKIEMEDSRIVMGQGENDVPIKESERKFK